VSETAALPERIREAAQAVRARSALRPRVAIILGTGLDALARDIEALLAAKNTAYWVEALLAAGVAVGPVNTYDEMLRDPHLVARGVTTVVEHPTLGPLDALSSALRLSTTPPQIRRPAPLFGQHSAQVLGEFGIGAEEVRAMQASGAVFDPSLAETVGAS
jgi:formyl-CoA transferase